MIDKNPIARQSQTMLKESLIRLMNKKPYEAISITDISKEADLARRTFYRHYETKKDILMDIFDDYARRYTETLIINHAVLIPDITEAFFYYWSSHFDFLRLLAEQGLFYMLLDAMNEKIGDIYEQVKGEETEFTNQMIRDYALTFSVGGHFNILKQWIENGQIEDPKKMKRVIEEIVTFMNARF